MAMPACRMYGRGGWCDGLQCDPWVADVTNALGPPGQVNVLRYEGLYEGRQPAPQQSPGAIKQEASLVLYVEKELGRLLCRVVPLEPLKRTRSSSP